MPSPFHEYDHMLYGTRWPLNLAQTGLFVMFTYRKVFLSLMVGKSQVFVLMPYLISDALPSVYLTGAGHLP